MRSGIVIFGERKGIASFIRLVLAPLFSTKCKSRQLLRAISYQSISNQCLVIQRYMIAQDYLAVIDRWPLITN